LHLKNQGISSLKGLSYRSEKERPFMDGHQLHCGHYEFPIHKCAIFRKIKENKGLRGDVR
jgi:hypothetical protein